VTTQENKKSAKMLPIKLIQGKMKVQEQQIRQASENK